MQKGSVIIYDDEGMIFCVMGEEEGETVIPHKIPKGVNYIEKEFGYLQNNFLISVDVSKTPHELISEEITIRLTPDQARIKELEEALMTAGAEIPPN